MQQSETPESLVRRICRTLTRTDNEFALFFVLVNLPAARKEFARQVIAQTARPVVELSVDPDALQNTTLDGWLLPRLEDATADSVVFLHDLDKVLPAEKKPLLHFLQQVNWRRSALAAIQRPLVIWLPRYALDNLAEYAPDFYDWYSNVYEFASPEQELVRITDGFISEFGTEVHPADRLSKAEKQEWLHTLTVLLDEHLKRNAYRAKLLNDAGQLHKAVGNLDDALNLYRQSLAIYRELDNKKGEAETLGNISQIYHARGDYDTALKYLEQALEIAQEIGDKKEAGAALNNISLIYKARGDYDTALEYLKQSLGICRKIGAKSGEGATLNNISLIYNARGDYDTALEYLKQSLEIQREIGDKSGEGRSLNNIGHIYGTKGDLDTAIKYLKQAFDIRQELGDKAGIGNTLNNISQVYHDKGDLDTALEYLKQSLKIQRETGDVAGLCATLFNIGYIYREHGEEPKAMRTWVRVYLLAKEIGLAQALQELEKLAEHLGLKGGLEGWEKLATRFTDKKNSVP